MVRRSLATWEKLVLTLAGLLLISTNMIAIAVGALIVLAILARPAPAVAAPGT